MYIGQPVELDADGCDIFLSMQPWAFVNFTSDVVCMVCTFTLDGQLLLLYLLTAQVTFSVSVSFCGNASSACGLVLPLIYVVDIPV